MLFRAILIATVSIGLAACDKTKQLGFSADGSQQGAVNFAGVQSLSVTSGGRFVLLWDLALGSSDVSGISYEVYLDRWSEIPDSVKPLPNIDSKNAASNLTQGAFTAELDTRDTPASKGLLVSSVKGGRSYTIEDSLSTGSVYVFQVKSVSSDGVRDSNNRVLIYNPDNTFRFSGLQTSGVTTAADLSKISLTWSPATGAKTAVTYLVYSDANFSNVIYTTSATSYDYLNPEKGKTYTFAVRAKDGSTLDTNSEFVVVSVPDPSDKAPPVFAGLASAEVASDKKILLKWQPSPSGDIGRYYIYSAENLSQALASTTSSFFMMTNLSPGTQYSYVVRARDSSGNEERNSVQKSATTLTTAVPDFLGIASVNRAEGEDGLTKLDLSWAQGGATTAGYKVYQSLTSESFDFTSPIYTAATPTETTYTAAGLASNTTYYFVVRAYDSSNRFELNTIEKSNSTLPIVAPTFAGATTASAGAGSLAFTTADLTWPAPSSNGIWNGFVVQYELGSCSTAFSNSPSETIVSGAGLRAATVTGLSPQQTYRMRVRTHRSSNDLRDGNTVCREVYTSPAAPSFAGISSLTRASGVSGFSQATASWTAATGSFSYYKIEWSTNSNFSSATTVTPNTTTIGTTSKVLTGLPTNTTVYVRVSAVFDDSGLQLASGQAATRSVITTPTVPTGEGISDVEVTAADSLLVTWTAPTNFASSLYNGYKLWKYCGTNAATNLISLISSTPNPSDTYPANQLSTTFTGLASNTECCYQVRAYYLEGANSLASTSSAPYRCKTPTLTAPTFAGVATVANNNQATGFTQLEVSWPAVDASQSGLFSYYEIDWATTSSGHTWNVANTIKITNLATTSTSITGLTENTTYYVRIRAVNNAGSPAVSNGSDVVLSGTTTPKTPTGDNLSAAAALGSTKVRLTYTPPSATLATGGLFNNIFLYVQAGVPSNVTTARTAIEAGGVLDTEIQGTLSASVFSVTSLPALIQVPVSEIPGNNTIDIWGLTANTQVCVQAVAVYWVNGQPTRYLPSNTPTTRCATPAAVAPTFAGVSSLSSFGDQRDFSQMTANWTLPSGDCTGIDVSVTTAQGTPNFAGSYQDLSCSATSQVLSGLTPHQIYYVQVRAKNVVSGTTYAAGNGIELSKNTRPVLPSGDGVVSATFTSVAKSKDRADLVFTLPTVPPTVGAGFWNKIMIWKATASGIPAARTAVQAAAATRSDNSGPTTAAVHTIAKTGATPTTWTDTDVTDGLSTCYLVRGVYDDGTSYAASINTTTSCGNTSYSTPSIGGGAASAALDGTWPDGTAKIKLNLGSIPSGDVESYNVYISYNSTIDRFDLTSPWQTVDAGDATFDTSTSDAFIHVGNLNRTFSGTIYYVVRYEHIGGPDVDSNTSVVALSIPTSQSNFVFVDQAKSKLGYSYYIGAYEASIESGSLGTFLNDVVTSSDADLTACSYQFHVNDNPFHSSCGTKTTTAKLIHKKGVAPVGTYWSSAFAACRNSTDGGVRQRLPTEEEWRRASQWSHDDYTGATGSFEQLANCRHWGDGTSTVTGAYANCKSRYGAYDMAGNVSEWADQRAVGYDIAAAGQSRFGYGPTISRLLANGIDTQHEGSSLPLTRRLHNSPDTSVQLQLALGSTHNVQWGDVKGDVERENWYAPSGTTGVRCVAFPNKVLLPSMLQLAQTQEPKYASSDLPGGATANASQLAAWKIPEHLYVRDTKPETVVIESPFPNTANLSAWNFNNTSTSNLTVSDVVGGNHLTMNSSSQWTAGAGLNGTNYANTIVGSGSYAGAQSGSVFSGALYRESFTMGAWVRFPTASGGNIRLMKSAFNTSGLCNGATPPTVCGLILHIGTDQLKFEYGDGTTYEGLFITPLPNDQSWHHVVVVRKLDKSQQLYVDGVLAGSSTSAISVQTNDQIFGVTSYAGTPDNQLAAMFYHGGTTYTPSDITKLYQHGLTNKYFSSSSLDDFKVKFTWSPWSKQSCSPSCTTVDETLFNYDIYRYVEPTKIDVRFRMPWAIGEASDNPYTTTMPMNPLMTDASGAAICTTSTSVCKLVATISGSSCNTSTPNGCQFDDSPALGNGFDPKKIYNYMMVVRDAQGNAQFPVVQRYRTFDLTGLQYVENKTPWRTEPRYRRASVFLVDEAFQHSASATQANPQAMVYVPMDQSGLDHDFFIDKYEASSYSGTPSNDVTSNGTSSGTWPLQADATGTWVNKAAQCYLKFWRTGTLDPFFCGNGLAAGSGGVLNATSTILQSKQNSTPAVALSQGAFWKACANTAIVDGSSNLYRKRLPSDPEWHKAADWGDFNLDGTIDVGMNVGQLFGTIEFDTANTTTVRCHSDHVPDATFDTNSSQTANCRTRYGAADMVGNVSEFTTGQTFDKIGLDNGLDGLWMAYTFKTTDYYSSNPFSFDLLRGSPPLNAATAADLPSGSNLGRYYYWPLNGLKASMRGGNQWNTLGAGRWDFALLAPQVPSGSYGARCSY